MRWVRNLSTIGFLAAGLACAQAADALAPIIDAPIAAVPGIYTWSGPYAGGFVGYNFAEFDQAGGAAFDGEGAVGGVYAGYNFQAGRVVYGLEADIGGSDVDAGGFNAATGLPLSSGQSAFGSVRGRLGYAMDSFMVFATGGLAVSEQELALGVVHDTNTHLGYTLGAGIEAEILDNVTSRIEYRYSDYQSEDYRLGNVTISSGFDEHSIRAGLALKF